MKIPIRFIEKPFMRERVKIFVELLNLFHAFFLFPEVKQKFHKSFGRLKMKKIAIVLCVTALSACTGSRGMIGKQKVCTNDYLPDVISISEMISPCNK